MNAPPAAPLTVDGWLRVVLSSAGPRSTVRFVLAVAARHMDWQKPSTFVGARRLAADTGLDKETVTTALLEAEAGGWIERSGYVRGARREMRPALPVSGSPVQSEPREVYGSPGQSGAASVRVVSGLTGSSVRIDRSKCTDHPDKPLLTSSLPQTRAREREGESEDQKLAEIRHHATQAVLAGKQFPDDVLNGFPSNLRNHPDARLIVRAVLREQRTRLAANHS